MKAVDLVAVPTAVLCQGLQATCNGLAAVPAYLVKSIFAVGPCVQGSNQTLGMMGDFKPVMDLDTSKVIDPKARLPLTADLIHGVAFILWETVAVFKGAGYLFGKAQEKITENNEASNGITAAIAIGATTLAAQLNGKIEPVLDAASAKLQALSKHEYVVYAKEKASQGLSIVYLPVAAITRIASLALEQITALLGKADVALDKVGPHRAAVIGAKIVQYGILFPINFVVSNAGQLLGEISQYNAGSDAYLAQAADCLKEASKKKTKKPADRTELDGSFGFNIRASARTTRHFLSVLQA